MFNFQTINLSTLRILKFDLVFFILFFQFFVQGQELLQSSRINSENKGVALYYTSLFKAFGETYYTTPGGGYQRIQFGDTLLVGQRSDTLVDYHRHDQFFVKFDEDQKVMDSWVIDNCEFYFDQATVDSFQVLLVQVWDEEDGDSLAIMTMPDGTEIHRKDYLGQSLLITVDSNFNHVKHVSPTTGRIRYIEGGEEFLYMGIEIPDGVPYILVGQDTVNNYYHSFHMTYFTSLVLGKYDMRTDEFVWWKRMGSQGDDALVDLKLDHEENLIALIRPAGELI
jgi:hypothetical protein